MKTPIVFFGTGHLAARILEALLADQTVAVLAVITKPDAPAGRGHHLQAPPIKELAAMADVRILQPSKAKDILPEIRARQAPVAVLVEYGKILPTEVIALFAKGIINVHPSLLPRYRGPSPVQSALLHGEKETGVTIMLLDEEMDHGPVLAQRRVAIAPDDTAQTLLDKLAQEAGILLTRTINDYLSGAITPQPQDHTKATYSKMLTREDGAVQNTETPTQTKNRLAAFTPWPGLFTIYQGKLIKILALTTTDANAEMTPGTWWLTKDKKPALVVAGGSIILERVQPEGKKPMTGEDFSRGYLQGLFSNAMRLP